MRTFLVTGGAGFIGSHIATALMERGDQVRVFDNLSTGHHSNLTHLADSLEFMEGDLLDADAVSKAVDGVDCVFHQAALASVPRSVEAPLDTNAACVTGTVTLLDAARRAGVRRLVYAASSSLYGDKPTSSDSSKKETDLPDPISPYGVAKLAGEYYCHAFTSTYGFETVALRYFNVFGPRQDPGSPYSAVIPLFITAILENRPPVIFGNGQQSRDFTFVENVVHGNLLAADAEGVAGQSFNIAAGRSVTLLEMLAILNKYLGTEMEPEFVDPRPGDILESLADISAARRLLGYEPQVSFEEGIAKSIDYYRTIYEQQAMDA